MPDPISFDEVMKKPVKPLSFDEVMRQPPVQTAVAPPPEPAGPRPGTPEYKAALKARAQRDANAPMPQAAPSLTDVPATPEGLAAERETQAAREHRLFIEARNATHKDDPLYQSSGMTADERRAMAARRDKSVEEQARQGWETSIPGRIVTTAAAPIMGPIHTTKSLIEQQQPGGRLFNASGGKVALEAGGRGLAAGIGSAGAVAFPGAQIGFSAAAPVTGPALEAIDVGPAIARGTGSEALGELGSAAEQMLIFAGASRAAKPVGRVLGELPGVKAEIEGFRRTRGAKARAAATAAEASRVAQEQARGERVAKYQSDQTVEGKPMRPWTGGPAGDFDPITGAPLRPVNAIDPANMGIAPSPTTIEGRGTRPWTGGSSEGAGAGPVPAGPAPPQYGGQLPGVDPSTGRPWIGRSSEGAGVGPVPSGEPTPQYGGQLPGLNPATGRPWTGGPSPEGPSPLVEPTPAPVDPTGGYGSSFGSGRGMRRGGGQSGALGLPDPGDIGEFIGRMTEGGGRTPILANTPEQRVSDFQTTGARSKAAQVVDAVFKDLNRKWVDRFSPVEKAERSMPEGLTETGPTAALRVAGRSAAGAAEEYAQNGRLGATQHKGLTDILAPVMQGESALRVGSSQRLQEFKNYVLSLREMDYRAAGYDFGLKPEDAAYYRAKYANDPVFQQAARDFTEWQRQPWREAMRAAGIPEEQITSIEAKNPNYTRILREFDPELEPRRGAGTGPVGGEKPLVKTRKGSDRLVRDPVEAAISEAQKLIATKRKLDAQRALVEWAKRNEASGSSRFVEKITDDKARLETARAIADEAGGSLTPQEANAAAVMAEAAKLDKTNSAIVRLYENGEPVAYRLNPELARIYRDVGPEGAAALAQIHPLLKAVGVFPAKMVKLGATGVRLSFSVLANPFRDFFTSGINSRYTGAYFHGLDPRGEGRSLYRGSSSTGGSFAGAELGDSSSAARRIARRATGRKGEAVDAALHPVDTAILKLSQITENIPRRGEFIASLREDGWRPGGAPPTEAMLLKAANRAADVTVDFSRGGEWARYANQFVPFLNPSIQGLAKEFRQFKNVPLKTTAKWMAYVGIPTLANWWLQKDDPNYQDTRKSNVGRGYWHSPGGFRFPRPQGVYGLASNALEDWADAAYRNGSFPEELARSLEDFAQRSLVPNAPPVPGLIHGLAGNTDQWDKPIVPRRLEDVSPEEQYTERTSETAKTIGRSLGVSPAKVDWGIGYATGGIGQDIVQTAESLAGVGPQEGWKKPPIVGRFMDTGLESGAGDEFWQRYSELRQFLANDQARKREPALRGRPTEIDKGGALTKQLNQMGEAARQIPALKQQFLAETDKAKKQLLRQEIRSMEESLLAGVKLLGDKIQSAGLAR